MEEVILLIDYRDSFSSKFDAIPYRSGIDLDIFNKEMGSFGFDVKKQYFWEIEFSTPALYENKVIIYQGSETNDEFGQYKSFIDDVLYFLKMAGAVLVPEYKYFKSHSNKVFMEMLRSFFQDSNKPSTQVYGTFEEFQKSRGSFEFPVIIKKSHGAQSNGVFKANTYEQLNRIVSKISRTPISFKERIKELVRKNKYDRYLPFSSKRNKFILQPFIEGLQGDFKILIFHDIFYVIQRDNPPNDFRASGGGLNSFIGEFELPNGLLEYAENLYRDFKCPYISLDVGINGKGFHLIEFQFISFGSSGHSKSKFYYKKSNGEFEMKPNELSLEFLYSYALSKFLNPTPGNYKEDITSTSK